MGHTKNKNASRKYTAKIQGDHMIAVNQAGTAPTAKYHVTLVRKNKNLSFTFSLVPPTNIFRQAALSFRWKKRMVTTDEIRLCCFELERAISL